MELRARTDLIKAPCAAIVGAGPAGCAAAVTLGRAGIAAVLIEQGAPGKDKACGDAFVESAVELLGGYGIDQQRIAALGGRRCERIQLFGPESLLRQINYGGWVVPRAKIDQTFRDIAAQHALVMYQTSVLGVDVEKDGKFHLSFRKANGSADGLVCDSVVIATGAGCRIARNWDVSGNSIMGVSISCYGNLESPPQELHFQFSEMCRPGYRWIFPAAVGRVNLGVCVLGPGSGRQLRQRGEDFLREMVHLQPFRWRGGGAPLWSGQGSRWHDSHGIVSCGDAAGLADPDTAEGLTPAILSGARAGDAIAQYLQGDHDPRPLEEYSSWIRERFTSEYCWTETREVWRAFYGT